MGWQRNMYSKKYVVAVAILTSAFASSSNAENAVSPRIVGGQDATISEAPWQAAVTIRRSGGTAFCGGIVIGSRWVLTAAHCLDLADDNDAYSLAPASEVSVYTGTAVIDGADFNSFRSGVSATFAHRDYNKNNFSNDIALLQLSSDINANASSISLATLADQSALDSNAGNNNQDLQLTGWGFTNVFGTQSTDILQKATLSAVSDSTCASQWAAETDLNLFAIAGYENNYLCAEQSSITACNGDSGGPLVWNDNGTSKLVGVVSFGVKTSSQNCPINRLPDVFTQVSNYSSWVSSCQAGSCNSFSPTNLNSGGGGGSFAWLSLLSLGLLTFRRRLS